LRLWNREKKSPHLYKIPLSFRSTPTDDNELYERLMDLDMIDEWNFIHIEWVR